MIDFENSPVIQRIYSLMSFAAQAQMDSIVLVKGIFTSKNDFFNLSSNDQQEILNFFRKKNFKIYTYSTNKKSFFKKLFDKLFFKKNDNELYLMKVEISWKK